MKCAMTPVTTPLETKCSPMQMGGCVEQCVLFARPFVCSSLKVETRCAELRKLLTKNSFSAKEWLLGG